jgi:hypothetical protein
MVEAKAPKRDLATALREEWGILWQHFRGAIGAPSRAHGSRPLLTAADFQEELALLGLSGRRFVPADYAAALGNYLGISINIHVIPDDLYPELSRRLAISGRLGELRYSEQLTLAAVFVPGSLPPLVSTLTILHELGHLAAGDVLIAPSEEGGESEDERAEGATFMTSPVKKGKRLARGSPFAEEALREREANMRASYALFAGCLGSDSPYADAMFSVL